MPKTPMDYSKCCIYKIENNDDESLVYVGHTTNFDKRKTQHKINCYNDKLKQYNYKVYQMVRQNGDWDAFKMIEVEKYPCNDRREAERRENEVIKELRASMNTYKSFRTQDEKTEYHTNYRELHKEKIQEYKKDYYELHKEKLQEKDKEYYETNKQEINEKVKCECGCEIVKQNLKRHQASKKHLDKMKNI